MKPTVDHSSLLLLELSIPSAGRQPMKLPKRWRQNTHSTGAFQYPLRVVSQ